MKWTSGSLVCTEVVSYRFNDFPRELLRGNVKPIRFIIVSNQRCLTCSKYSLLSGQSEIAAPNIRAIPRGEIPTAVERIIREGAGCVP
jgi:hypothetical protein